MSIYKHIFFDLDRTLWDFDTNSGEALQEIFEDLKLEKYFNSPAQFIKIYHSHNEDLWKEYRLGKVDKETMRLRRFDLTLRDVSVDNPVFAKTIGDQYLRLSKEKNIVFPFTHEILGYLFPVYTLYILTNGFRETQFSKLENSGLSRYFSHVFTSETIGFNKPHPQIFEWAVNWVKGRKEECLMIGDDYDVDILGAAGYGIDQVFFNPARIQTGEKATYEINSLIELKNIL